MAISTDNPRQRMANTGQLVEPDGMLHLRHGQLQDIHVTRGLARTLSPKAVVAPTRFRLIRATGIGMQRNKLL